MIPQAAQDEGGYGGQSWGGHGPLIGLRRGALELLLARLLALLDLDPARLQPLGLGDTKGQDAVGQRRLDAVGLEAPRHPQVALEPAEAALDPLPGALAVVRLVRVRALAPNGQYV